MSAIDLPTLNAERTGPDLEDVETRSAEGSILQEQVNRILHSEELRSSPVLRRLLQFLAEKSVAGEADELKEYIIAVDGLGKPGSYDPRNHSAVRIQVGRLRQKLADYYRQEGQNDPVAIEIPKGHFRLECVVRDCEAAVHEDSTPAAVSALTPDSPAPERRWFARTPFRVAAGMLLLLILVLGIAYSVFKPFKTRATAVSYSPPWTADMEELWRPIITTSRPVVMIIEDPTFVELDRKKGIYFRDRRFKTWQDVTASPAIHALQSALQVQQIAPTHHFTPFGEADSLFLLAKLLGTRIQNLSVMRDTDLSMRELADNDVIFLGVENEFHEQQQASPIPVPLQQMREGIRNDSPGPNEPAIFLDQYSTAPSDDGYAYALVSDVPGPLGTNDAESFTSSRAVGYAGAVKALTDPVFVRSLVANVKQACGGHMPRYYQILLKVKFTEEVPTEISYVLARELRYPGHS